MIDAMLIGLFGKPHGIIIFQMMAAARFTIYLSLVAFIGGGMVAALITLMNISQQRVLEAIARV